MSAWRGSFYGLPLEGARMDRMRVEGRHIIPIDGMIEIIYSPFLSQPVILQP